MEHDYNDPFCITGRFTTFGETIQVMLQTSNPTIQDRHGQVFVEFGFISDREPFNVSLSKMLRRLADSVEYEWEHHTIQSND